MGQSPGVSLPLLSYKSELLTTKPEARHHLLSEPTVADRREAMAAILFKAINRK